MKVTEIIALVNAGYTKEEISQMEDPNQETPSQELVPAPAVVEEPQPEPQPAPQLVQEQEHKEPTMAELMQSIAKLTSTVQANAIAQSVIPGGANPQTPTAEDMLAEIIRPTFKERSL